MTSTNKSGSNGNAISGNSDSSRQSSASQQSGNSGSSTTQAGTSGGTHEQHVETGRQSHKNDAGKSAMAGGQSVVSAGSSSRSGGSEQSASTPGAIGTRGGTPEQHAAAGRQSHKNDR